MKTHSERLRPTILCHALALALAAGAPGTLFAQQVDGGTPQATASTDQDEDTAEQSANGQTRTLDQVTVTGSRIKRAEVEGPAPVTVITADDIEKQGFKTVFDALNTLTQANGTVVNESTLASQSIFAPNANIINLRGLGPGRSLILINGRRVAEYPLPYGGQSNFVNLGAIPSSAVERIEVLSGGASAIYGSDAVAGVMNIVTKKNYEGLEAKLYGSTTTRGGGDTGNLQIVGGKSGDRWSLTYAMEYMNREAIFTRQRDFMDSMRDSPIASGRTPWANLYLYDFDAPGYVSEIADACDRFFGHSVVYTTASGSRCAQYDRLADSTIRSSDDNLSLYGSGVFDISGNTQLFMDAMWWKSKARYSTGTQWWSPYNEETGYYYYDVGRGALMDALRVFQPEETGRDGLMTDNVEESWSVTTGIRGSLFDNRFDYELSYSHAEYETDTRTPRLIASKVADYFLGPRLGNDPVYDYYPAYRLDYDRFTTPLTPSQFAAMSATIRPRGYSEASQFQATLSGDLFELPAGPVGMASVLEWGSQEYELVADPRTLPNADPAEEAYNWNDTGGRGARDRYALGLEFSVPIFSTLKAQLAARYDKYDDITEVDGAVTWNAGLEWRPVDSLLLRGSYATSFRAPDMHYVFAEPSGYYIQIFDEYRCRAENNNDVLAAACRDNSNTDYYYYSEGGRRGNRLLEEETSKSWTAGFVWDILDGLSVQADYYSIQLDQGVNDLSNGYVLKREADCRLGVDRSGNPVDTSSLLCQTALDFVQRRPSPTDPEGTAVTLLTVGPINTATEKTTGIDATVRYRWDTDRLGRFNVLLGWSHTLSYEFTQYAEDGVLYDRDNRSYNWNARSRANLSVNWNRGDWGANVYGSRMGSIPSYDLDRRIAPYLLWNANLSKKITDKMSVTLFVNNVFDKIHPRDDSYADYPYFYWTYSPIGREIGAQLAYRFQ